MGVAANVQGLWAYRDAEIRELVEPIIGPERSGRIYPIGSLARAGALLDRYAARCENFVLVVPRIAVLGARSAPRDTGNQPRALPGYQGQSPWLVGGSDWSVTSMNPIAAIQVATTRRGPRAAAGPAWLPDEVVTLDTMLAAYTINGARVQCQEDHVGSVKVGKVADLVVLDRDLTTMPPPAFRNAQVRYTFLVPRRTASLSSDDSVGATGDARTCPLPWHRHRHVLPRTWSAANHRSFAGSFLSQLSVGVQHHRDGLLEIGARWTRRRPHEPECARLRGTLRRVRRSLGGGGNTNREVRSEKRERRHCLT